MDERLDDDRVRLDEIYRSATEAGVRIPFTVSDLRRWAEDRLRRPKGHEGAGQFMKEIRLPDADKPEARASRWDVPSEPSPGVEEIDDLDLFDEEGDALDIPPAGSPRSRSRTWSLLGRPEPADVEKKRLAAQKREAAAKTRAANRATKMGTTKGRTQLAGRAVTSARKAMENADKALAAAKADAARAKREGMNKTWVPEMADEAVREATAAQKAVAAQLKIAEAALAKIQSNPTSARTVNPAHDKIDEALAAARAAKDDAVRAATKARKAADAKPSGVPFTRQTKDKDTGKLKDVEVIPRPPFKPGKSGNYDNPAAGYRKATEREFYELVGNGSTYSGAHVPIEPGNKAQINFTPAGTGVGVYTPEWNHQQERAKWERVERLDSGPADRLHDDLIAKIKDPKTPSDVKDSALATLITEMAGVRPGSPKGLSTVKDKDDPEYGKQVPTYGSSTLQGRHATILKGADGKPSGVRFKFRGKSGVMNDITVENPELAVEVARRKRAGKPNDQLFPAASSPAMGKLMAPFGFDEQEIASGDQKDESVAEEAAKELAGGKFKVKDLRTRAANKMAAKYFQQILSAKGLPQDREELIEWLNAAAWMGSDELGNQHQTFLDNYFALYPFRGVIEQMIEREKNKSRTNEPLDIEDYWPFGMKRFLPEDEEEE